MKVRVTQEFQWAPDGNHVRAVKAGEVLEGRGAQVALELKKGVELGVHQVTAELSAATERATRALLGVPESLRLPTVEEYVAAGATRERYADFIANRATHLVFGALSPPGADLSLELASALDAVEKAVLNAAAIAVATPPRASAEQPPPAPQAVPPPNPTSPAVPPDPMPGPDAAAKAELERQSQGQGPKAPEVAELPSRKELEKLTQQDLLALALSRGLTVEGDTGKGKLLKLLTAQ